MNKQELVKFLIKNFKDRHGDLDLTNLNFKGFKGTIKISNMIVDYDLDQSKQLVGGDLFQDCQKSKGKIIQDCQTAEEDIHQDHQNTKGNLHQEHQNSSGNLYQNYQNTGGSIWQDHQQFVGTLYNNNVISTNKIKKKKVTEIDIVVNATTNKPCYFLKYTLQGDPNPHIGYSSYNLDFVKDWLNTYFEVVEQRR